MIGIICLLIGLVIGAIIVYIIQQPKIKTSQKFDAETAEKNQTLQVELASLNAKKEEVQSSIQSLKEQADVAAEEFNKKAKELAQEKFEKQMASMDKACEIHQRECNSQYLEILEDLANDVQEQIQTYKNSIVNYEDTIKQLETQIEEKEAIVAAAVAANIRAAEMNNKQDFYRLNLSAEDINEIKKLREVAPYLRDSEPLNKVIWKVYYEKAYTDLIGRVVGSGNHTGIYKITNIENGMCYVGQAVNIADRWKQHIKRGVGAETPTRNKLYPAMLSVGVENFTFEVIEECDRSMLDKKEDYWQEYFKAKEYGYSIK